MACSCGFGDANQTLVATHQRMDAALQTARPDTGTALQADSRTEELHLAAIYSEYFKGVWRNLRRLGVPNELLDDAVQDVFLVVHRRRCEFAHRSSFKTWLFGIVLRVANDYRRAARRHIARTTQLAREFSEDYRTHCPAKEAELREANTVLHGVLQLLKNEQREVFVLVELEELSISQAATACSISLATCQRRLRRARIAFEAALARINAHSQPRGLP